jgi:hypothetical protein
MKYATVMALTVSALACGGVSAGTHGATASAATKDAPLPEVVIRAARVTQAVEGYVSAMSTHDISPLPRVFTDDAVVEFVSDTSGATLAVHADSLLDDTASGPNVARPHVTNLRLFPTKDANAVFVQYDLVADSSDRPDATSGRLALIEMRGDKIQKMVDFNAPAASLAHSSACVTPHDAVVTRR